ncbi:uncharacterized protein loaf [Eurosta solidaginis]|uniref:uncharacterized protein loaf n=1 Tax=Eurosta solidaginis TaxID=178769 RepID=UPI003530FAB7
MLLPTSCGPGPPLPPPPPPPPSQTTMNNNVSDKTHRLGPEKRVGKLSENVTQKYQKSIVGETKTNINDIATTVTKTATTAAARNLKQFAGNVLVEGMDFKSLVECVDDDSDDFSITAKVNKKTPTDSNCAANIECCSSNSKNKNIWSIFKLPLLLVAVIKAKTLLKSVADEKRKMNCETKTSTEQILIANKAMATVGTTATEIATATTMAKTSAAITTTVPVMKWLLMWLMIFAIMAQAPLHQVSAEKSKHYYMQALCKNHFLQQLYRKIDGAVLWSQNERNLDCIITFQTHSILQRFMLRFDMLQLDCNDHLYVYDGAHAVATPKIDISCRNTKQTVSSILTRTNFVTLKYVTDNWGTDANGFKLVITSVKDPKHTCNDFTCAAREFCISPDLLCDGINHCGDNSDESVCQSETATTVFGVDMTWFVLIVVGIVLVLSAVIVGISICVCRRQDEANLNQNTAMQMHHTAETNGSSKHLHYHHGGTLSREHTQLPPTSGNWHHPAGPYGYHRILRILSKMATKVRPIWCLANSVN